MASKKAPNLALLLADDGEGEEESYEEDKPSDEEYQELAVAAFPELEGDTERIDALKRFVMLCMEK